MRQGLTFQASCEGERSPGQITTVLPYKFGSRFLDSMQTAIAHHAFEVQGSIDDRLCRHGSARKTFQFRLTGYHFTFALRCSMRSAIAPERLQKLPLYHCFDVVKDN